jgi:hypothetical protein
MLQPSPSVAPYRVLQFMIPAEAAHHTVEVLGELGLLQFKDMNADKSAFQRTYANQVRFKQEYVGHDCDCAPPAEKASCWYCIDACQAHSRLLLQIKRCDEMARQLRFFTDEVGKSSIAAGPAGSLGDSAPLLDQLEARLGDMETQLVELNANSERLKRSYHELLELQLVLEQAGTFFEDARYSASAGADSDATAVGLEGELHSSRGLGFAFEVSHPFFLQLACCSSAHSVLIHISQAAPFSVCYFFINSNCQLISDPQNTHTDLGNNQLQGVRPTGLDAPSSDIGAPLLESAAGPPPEPKSVQLGFVAGTIPVEKLTPFERLLFRATRGNVYLRAASVRGRRREAHCRAPGTDRQSIEQLGVPLQVGSVADPASGERTEKAVFVLFFAGERAKVKILKVCI